MGHNLKWDSLDDFTTRQANIYAHCFLCNRTATFNSFALVRYFKERGWHLGLTIVYRKLRCRKCGQPAGKLGPTRKLPDTDPPKR